MEALHRTVRLLYTGQSQRARRFRYGLIVFDAVTIVYFIATAALPTTPVMTALNTGLGLLILLDWSCRAYVPVPQLIYAAFRSNANGLLPPSDECLRRVL